MISGQILHNTLRDELLRYAVTNFYFEQKIESLFKEGKLKGTLHLSFGQEAVDVGIIRACKYFYDSDPMVYGNHRSHGQYLTATDGDIESLFEEIMWGEGGTQHLSYPGKFLSNGIQGGMLPVAFGHALSNKKRNIHNKSRVLCFIGDGTLGQGNFYETLNLMSIFSVPLTIVIIDNGYSMSKTQNKVNIENLCKAFNIQLLSLSYASKADKILNPLMVFHYATDHFDSVRDLPSVIYCKTIRLKGHSINDTQAYRPADEKDEKFINFWNPMNHIWYTMGPNFIDKIHHEVEERIDGIIQDRNEQCSEEVITKKR
ncbi:MAG: hypothetical protein FK734_14610 [Asgard group archaeon]|nr:hypothetical protein [Asgard group archaeon]